MLEFKLDRLRLYSKHAESSAVGNLIATIVCGIAERAHGILR